MSIILSLFLSFVPSIQSITKLYPSSLSFSLRWDYFFIATAIIQVEVIINTSQNTLTGSWPPSSHPSNLSPLCRHNNLWRWEPDYYYILMKIHQLLLLLLRSCPQFLPGPKEVPHYLCPHLYLSSNSYSRAKYSYISLRSKPPDLCTCHFLCGEYSSPPLPAFPG